VSSFQFGLGVIKRSAELDPRALAFFPQRQSFPHSILLAVKASALDRVFDKCLLVWGKLYFHCFQRKEGKGRCQVPHSGEWLAAGKTSPQECGDGSLRGRATGHRISIRNQIPGCGERI
jgi:hypothetical protein